MKKLLALFLAALFIFSTATVIVSAGTIGAIQRDENNIAMVPYLDFNKEANDLWAVEDDNGKWSSKIEYGDYAYPGTENYMPIAAYLRDDQFSSGREYSFIENGEVLHVEMTGSNATPGLWFVLDEEHKKTIPVGSESADNKKAEYVKIRVRNHSACDRFTFGFVTSGTNTYKWTTAVVSDLKVDATGKQYKAAYGEWETYIFSMAAINAATNYNDLIPANPNGTPGNRWYGDLESFILFPFGYNVEDGTAPYVGASIDIDYVVIGSKEYVTNYESELEKKEKSIDKLDLITKPTKSTYYVGESLDLEGLQLKATYKDGTTEIFDSATASANLEIGAESTPVTLTFGSKSVTYDIKVIGVDHIELKKPADKTTYEAAELSGGFIPNGYTFEVTYTDGNKNDKIPSNKFACTAGDLSTPGKKNITANFYGFKTDFEIEVIAVTDIEVTAPTKKLYYKDKLDADDFTYTLVFSDGSKLPSDDAKTTLEFAVTADTKKAGDVPATITATNASAGINITKEVTVKYETPTALKVVSDPIKQTYQPGDIFDADGLAVALVYEGNKNVALDAEDFTARANLSNPGNARITIKCSLDGFEDLKLDENKFVTVEGEVTPPESSSSSTTRAPQGGNEGGISPVIIVVIVVVVLAAAGVVVFLVIKKKK